MFPDLSQEKGEREGEEVGERQREQVRVVGGSSPAKKKNLWVFFFSRMELSLLQYILIRISEIASYLSSVLEHGLFFL